jgi:hypothetical protein
MTMSTILLVTLVVLGVALIGAGLLLSWQRGSVRPAASATPSGREAPQVLAEEFLAAPISEAVEDLVNQQLAVIPGLAGTHVDFGTAADGSLEIWVGEERYTSVDEIRDPRIRQAVKDAVAFYNG